jgi:hypothetical protein
VTLSLASVELDWRTGEVVVRRSDGLEARTSIDVDDEIASTLARSTWIPGAALAQVETIRGDEIVCELPRPLDMAPTDGRPTVYLDQNMWSTLANSVHEPGRASNEYAAARHLIELVRNRRVILPLSSGHMLETTKWGDAGRRYRLGLTMMQLSAGWQLRDPLRIRRFELRQTFTTRYRRRCLVQRAGVTLEPGAIHQGRDLVVDAPADFPPSFALAHSALTAWLGNVATLLDPERIPNAPPMGWAEHLQRLTNWLASEPRHRAGQRRDRTNLIFLADLRRELAEEAHAAGIEPSQMSNWNRHHSDADIAEMSSLGLYRECLREKMLDPRTNWQPNDLTDLMYLSCASGYADYVVGERHAVACMKSGLRRLDRPVNVYRRLSDLVATLSRTAAG